MTRLTIRQHFLSRLSRVPIAVTVSLASLVLILVAFAMARKFETRQPDKDAVGKPEAKPRTPWNLALGNVVVLAPELGLTISAPQNANIETARVAARIAAQMTGLRQIYREQSEGDPSLLGGLTLQLTLGTAGQVAEATVLSAQLKDKDFRKAIVAEAVKWNFGELAPDGTVIDCPLLFVREGMDIVTLVNWEKTLRSRREEQPPVKSMPEPGATKKQK
jgi:hypothetical protein